MPAVGQAGRFHELKRQTVCLHSKANTNSPPGSQWTLNSLVSIRASQAAKAIECLLAVKAEVAWLFIPFASERASLFLFKFNCGLLLMKIKAEHRKHTTLKASKRCENATCERARWRARRRLLQACFFQWMWWSPPLLINEQDRYLFRLMMIRLRTKMKRNTSRVSQLSGGPISREQHEQLKGQRCQIVRSGHLGLDKSCLQQTWHRALRAKVNFWWAKLISYRLYIDLSAKAICTLWLIRWASIWVSMLDQQTATAICLFTRCNSHRSSHAWSN